MLRTSLGYQQVKDLANIWKSHSGLLRQSSGSQTSEHEKEQFVAGVLLQPACQSLKQAKHIKKKNLFQKIMICIFQKTKLYWGIFQTYKTVVQYNMPVCIHCPVSVIIR